MIIENSQWMRWLRGGFWIHAFGCWLKVHDHGLASLVWLDRFSIEVHRRWWAF